MIRRPLTTFLAVAAPCVLSTAAAAQRRTISVSGVAIDSATDGAVLNAAAAATGRGEHAAVDSLGGFRLTLPAGRAYLVTVSAPGFQPIGQVVDGADDVDLGRVELPPVVYALAPVNVSVSLLDERIRTAAVSARLIRSDLLERSTEQTLLEFLSHRVPLRTTPCSLVDTAPATGECVLVRGWPRRPAVYVDDAQAPSGLRQLAIYRPSEAARVEVFQGGMAIYVYTRGYLEMMERTHRVPLPLLPSK